MGWRNRSVNIAGSVLYKGRMPPRLGEFAAPLKAGGVGGKAIKTEAAHWAAELKHPKWGSATVVCLRDMPLPPPALIDFDPNLSPAERTLIKTAGSVVTVQMKGQKGDVLRDRKALLRFLRVLMADDGLAAMDHTASRFWSRSALDEELSHEADLDVESIFIAHAISDSPSDESDEEAPCVWLHTHGLAEIGFFDFDILSPHESILNRAFDTLRAMAFGILEEEAKLDSPQFPLAGRNGTVRLMAVTEFERRASPQYVRLRVGADDFHSTNRVVLCEPQKKTLMGKWLDRPAPCRWLQEEMEGSGRLVHFSKPATQFMADRARGTWTRFQVWSEELAEFECTPIAKLGYETDAGNGDKEHLWFEVHEARDSSLIGTLGNEPYNIARLHAGERGEHSLDRLTDWAIITPAGMINPRNTNPLRKIRENREQLREIMARARVEKGAD